MRHSTLLVVAAFAATLSLFVAGCEDAWDFFYRRIFLCTINPTPENCNSPLGGNDPGGEDDLDPDGTAIETVCDGETFLKVWTQGSCDIPGVVWAALEKNGKVISYSPGLSLETGSFAGYYLRIPLDGLQLDGGLYAVSLYASTGRSEVGDPAHAIERYADVIMRTFPERTRIRVAGRQRTVIRSGYDDHICMFSGDNSDLTVKDVNDHSGIQIIAGHNYKDNIVWTVGGDVSGAGTVTNNGRFTAILPASTHSDCYVVAEDTLRGFVDTLGVIIDPDTLGGCSQDYKWAGVEYSSNDDLVGASCSLSTFYGKLCDGLDTSNQAHSLAWVSVYYDTNLSGPDPVSRVWAQCGYMRIRFPGSYIAFDARYSEMQGNVIDWKVDIYKPHPDSGTVHKFQIECNPATGKWYAYLDDQVYDTLQESNPIWQSILGHNAYWSGEILNPEDDIPGVLTEKCHYTECQVRGVGPTIYAPVDFRAGTSWFSYSDTLQWQVDTTGANSLDVWDVNPRP